MSVLNLIVGGLAGGWVASAASQFSGPVTGRTLAHAVLGFAAGAALGAAVPERPAAPALAATGPEILFVPVAQ